jgi:beta-N-acetylhexosaminidase
MSVANFLVSLEYNNTIDYKNRGHNMGKKYYMLIISLISILLLLVGCNIVGEKQPNNNEIEKEKPVVDLIKEKIKTMTLEEKIGQMVIIGLDSYNVDENTVDMIQNKKVGGFILFKKNVNDSGQLLNLVNSLKEQNSNNKIPLFISIDEEGGKVSRVPNEFKNLPTNREIGKVNNEDFSYEIGNILAMQLNAFGINMDFAPVLDVNTNPNNPVIGNRSFGNEPNIVSDLGIATMKGIKDKGVIPVVKHFPGHGDTSVDSHIGLPSIDNDLNRLNEIELVPFKNAIKNKADVVMVAHILMTKIDPNYPASMSKKVINDILRDDLNFDGVVITDDMTMGAILKNYDINDAAIKSVNAGTDIILVCHNNDNQVNIINSLIQGVKDGEISEDRIDESVYRILKLKDKYNINGEIINSVDVDNINYNINKVLDTYTNK